MGQVIALQKLASMRGEDISGDKQETLALAQEKGPSESYSKSPLADLSPNLVHEHL